MNESPMIAAMKKRISVRTYAPRPIDSTDLADMSMFLENNEDNPFGAAVRFVLLNGEMMPRLGAYGMIKGAQSYFSGCVKKGPLDLEGFGFAFERAVLHATQRGLGTCWIGGLFRRGAFDRALKPEDELLPAISPLGYPGERRSIADRAVAAGAGARSRKPFGELFFDGDLSTPMHADEKALGSALEMVRIGPSASNKQPWRAVNTDSGCHFYLKADKKYAGNRLFGICMQRIDMGIAACHFSLAAQELGMTGGIVVDDPKLPGTGSAGLSYSFSWR